MPLKRRRGKLYAGPVKKRGKTMSRHTGATRIQAAVRRVLARTVEIKQTVHSATDGTEIFHNNFIVLDTNILETTQGVADHMTAATNNRIGDEINLKGVSMKFMVELNERYSDVTFRMFVVKKAKGDTLDASTFFTGLSGNKMIDTINTERFSVLYTKTFKVVAGNAGTLQNMQGSNSGIWGVATSSANQGSVLSRATKIVKVFIPGSKFGRGGKIQYENGSAQPKFFDYQVLLFAYSNWSTALTVAIPPIGWYVGRLNDYVRVLKYTDS